MMKRQMVQGPTSSKKLREISTGGDWTESFQFLPKHEEACTISKVEFEIYASYCKLFQLR